MPQRGRRLPWVRLSVLFSLKMPCDNSDASNPLSAAEEEELASDWSNDESGVMATYESPSGETSGEDEHSPPTWAAPSGQYRSPAR